MTNAEKNARARLAARTTVQLLSAWDLTEVLPMPRNPPLARTFTE